MKDIAVIMAAGKGERMRPLTQRIPKPLVPVFGEPMIETVLNALVARGVEEIYLVIGYLAEQFSYIPSRYPMVQLVYNSDFETYNNISSIGKASSFMGRGNCFVCEADIYVKNPQLLCRPLSRSCYFGEWVEGEIDDWVFYQDRNGTITQVKKGGCDLYKMLGVSYFLQPEALQIANKTRELLEGTGQEGWYWDEVVDLLLPKLSLTVEPLATGDICEIDSMEELVALDCGCHLEVNP